MIDTQITTIEDVFTLPQQKFLNDHFDGIMLEFTRLHQRIEDVLVEMRAMNKNLSERIDRLDVRVNKLDVKINGLEKAVYLNNTPKKKTTSTHP